MNCQLSNPRARLLLMESSLLANLAQVSHVQQLRSAHLTHVNTGNTQVTLVEAFPESQSASDRVLIFGKQDAKCYMHSICTSNSHS